MEPLHTEKQINEKTGLSRTSLKQWRHMTKATGSQVGPIFRKIRGCVFYRLKDVTNWIEREEIVSNGRRSLAV